MSDPWTLPAAAAAGLAVGWGAAALARRAWLSASGGDAAAPLPWAVAGAFAWVAAVEGPRPALLAWDGLLLAAVLTAAAVDRARRIIPNPLLSGTATLAAVLALWLRPLPWPAILAGGLGLGVLSGLLALGGGLGMGDAKLLALIGGMLGPGAGALALALGSAVLASVGLARVAAGRGRLSDRLAFAPALAVGTAAALAVWPGLAAGLHAAGGVWG